MGDVVVAKEQKAMFERKEIMELLSLQGEEEKALLDKALQCKLQHVGNKVHLRGLVEYSSRCTKDCLYCGLRSSNTNARRYAMTEEEVLLCARQALDMRYGSIAIQCGERSDRAFADTVARLCRKIKEMSDGNLGITLSCGEQSEEVYRQWMEAGAHRYLLRIESSTEGLYYKIHPRDERHSFQTRLRCIETLRELGYQTGTGVMIGLPFQTTGHLADDLLFFQKMDVAMVGMGPFIPHPDTPLWQYRNDIPSAEERLRLTLKMIAVLRLMMPEINMVSATANQTIDPRGREKAIQAGANVIMPNLSPEDYRKDYLIYPDKPCVSDTAVQCANCLEMRMKLIGHEIEYDAWGDSKAFLNRRDRKN